MEHAAGYELVVSRSAPPAPNTPALHVRAIQRRGQQDPTLCGQVKDGKPVRVDPYQSLLSQVTCVRCRRVLDGLR